MSYLQKDEILKLVRRVVEAGDIDAYLVESKILHSRGKGIVDTVLEELFHFKESGALARQNSFVAFSLILCIESYAEPRHAKRIAEILLWDEVSLLRDGSTRHYLLRILKRIGGAEEIPFLEQLGVKVKGVVYEKDGRLPISHLQKIEQRDIREVITAVRMKEGLMNLINSSS